LTMTPGNFIKAKDKEVLAQYVEFCLRFGFALKKEMVPKAPPVASLSPTAPVPGPGRFASLPPPAMPAVAPAAVDSKAARPVNGKVVAPEEQDPALVPPSPSLPPLIIVGPSGVGKGTLIARLQAALPGRFGFSVSHTTRAPRPGEVDGTSYHFVSLEAMKKEVEETDHFLEFAHVHGNIYGTSKAAVNAVRERGEICILDIDVQGARTMKERCGLPDAKYLFIAPPGIESLETRLRGRGTESEEKIQTRLANARGELTFCEENRSFFDGVLVNEDLGRATKEIVSLMRSWYPALKQEMKAQLS